MTDEVLGVRAVFDFEDFMHQVDAYDAKVAEAEAATQKYVNQVNESWEEASEGVEKSTQLTVKSLRDMRWRIVTFMFFMRMAGRAIKAAWEQMEAGRENALNEASTRALARAYRVEVESIVSDLMTLTEAGMTTKDAMAIVNQGMLADHGQFASSYSDLWKTALISARASGKEAIDVFGEIVEALAEADAKALETATPFNNLESAVESYAEAQGVAVDELDTFAVQQILLQRTLEDTSILIGQGAEVIGVQTSGVVKLSESWDNFLRRYSAITNAFEGINNLLETLGTGLEIGGYLVEFFSANLAGLWNVVKAGPGVLLSGKKAIDAWSEGFAEAIREYEERLNKVAEIEQGVGFREDVLAPELGGLDIEKLTGSLESAISSYEDLRSKHIAKLIDIDSKYLADVEKLTKNFNEGMTDIYEAYADRVTDIQQRHVDRLYDINQRHTDALARGMQRYTDEMLDAEISLATQRERAIRQANYRISDLYDNEQQRDYNALAKHLLRMQQVRERYVLNRIQSEREYQYDRDRLIAEGDVLAIEDLDARHGFEQMSDEENLELRLKQMQESFDQQQELRRVDLDRQIDDIRRALDRQLYEISIRDARRRANIQREYERDLRDAAVQRERARRNAEIDAFRDIADAAARRDKRLADEQAQYDQDLVTAKERRDKRAADEAADFLARQKAWAEHWVEIASSTGLGLEDVYSVFKTYFGEGELLDQLYHAFFARREREASIMDNMMRNLRGEGDVGASGTTGVGGQSSVGGMGAPAQPYMPGPIMLSWTGAPIKIQVEGSGESIGMTPQSMDQILQAVMVTLTTSLRETR